jgi:outer membrane lipoprotein LolB
MKHWVRGVSSPLYKVDKLLLDNLGRPQTLYQAGWKISYSKYSANTYDALPRKIFITRAKDDLRVKMIVRRWQGI